jgi:aspartate kinase
MRILVMKFGGTSVADPEKIQRAADRAIAARRRGFSVVVVVSAPGEMTDELLSLAGRVAPKPDERELDQLLCTGEQVGIALFALACRAKGAPAVSLTGPQAGIEAGGAYTRAHVVRIRPKRILKELRAGRIVAVAGFQALTVQGDVATLGRGGSDLTAVALASALKTRQCEIYSDVKGVYTADPRLVFEARKLKRITFEEMLELAGAGAQVMQARSLEIAERFGVSIHVRSAFHPQNGTWIVPKEDNVLEKAFVSSLALDKNEVRLSVVDVPDRPGVAAQVLSALARKDIPIDMIIQSAPTHSGVNDISLMTPRAHAAQAKDSLAAIAKKLKARVDVHDKVAKVSAVGTGFRHHPWVAATMFEALARHKINIHMIVASDLRVSCVVDLKQGEPALRALHKAYGLERKRR